MPNQLSATAMGEPIQLPPRLNLATVPALVADLRTAAAGDVVLDASDVVHFGALGVQALLSARASGMALRLVNATDRVRAQLTVMGQSPEKLSEGEP